MISVAASQACPLLGLMPDPTLIMINKACVMKNWCEKPFDINKPITTIKTSNCIVKITTEIALCNPMSYSGDNYRELLDGQDTLNLEPCLLSWKYNS